MAKKSEIQPPNLFWVHPDYLNVGLIMAFVWCAM